MDNASFHCSDRIKQMCLDAGVKLVYLPPYSPDFSPIEEFFSELKAFIKRKWKEYEDNQGQDFGAYLELCVDVAGGRKQTQKDTSGMQVSPWSTSMPAVKESHVSKSRDVFRGLLRVTESHIWKMNIIASRLQRTVVTIPTNFDFVCRCRSIDGCSIGSVCFLRLIDSERVLKWTLSFPSRKVPNSQSLIHVQLVIAFSDCNYPF